MLVVVRIFTKVEEDHFEGTDGQKENANEHNSCHAMVTIVLDVLTYVNAKHYFQYHAYSSHPLYIVDESGNEDEHNCHEWQE